MALFLLLFFALSCVITSDSKSVLTVVPFIARHRHHRFNQTATIAPSTTKEPADDGTIVPSQSKRIDGEATFLSSNDIGGNDVGDGKVLKSAVNSVIRTLPAQYEYLVEDHIYWSAKVEEQLAANGFTTLDDHKWLDTINSSFVSNVERGCGRMQNRLVDLSDGSSSCARYRHNDDQIQGEIYSFALARALGINNLPPTALVSSSNQRFWSHVHQQIDLAQWRPSKAVVLTKYITDTRPAFIPTSLRNKTRKRLHESDLRNLNSTELLEAAQWSDLIVFDYLTGNLDRVVNNMFNEQWNADMMNSPAHNLVKTRDNQLMFVDNESGLLHGYRLLSKYEHYHRSLLDALCLFRRSTATAVQTLLQHRNLTKVLSDLVATVSLDDGGRPGHHRLYIAPLPDRNVRTLQQRLANVSSQIKKCNLLYNN